MNRLGSALRQECELDEASNQLETAVRPWKTVELAPGTARPHDRLGHALLARGDGGSAIASLAHTVELGPGFVPARADLASAHMADQRVDLAVEQYREIVRLSPMNAEAHSNLGIALGSQRRLSQAIEGDPTLAAAQANLRTAVIAQSSRWRPARTP